MPVSFLDVEPRSFIPVSVPGLTTEAREAVNAALKAMTNWRNEMADTSEINGQQVIEGMTKAAKALGWPKQIVDAARTQMQSISKMQIQTMDRMMDVWIEQLKSPNPMATSPSAMLSKLKSLPGVGTAWPNAEDFQMAAMNPLQFWMQFTEQCQKSWTDSMTFWSKAGKPH